MLRSFHVNCEHQAYLQRACEDAADMYLNVGMRDSAVKAAEDLYVSIEVPHMKQRDCKDATDRYSNDETDIRKSFAGSLVFHRDPGSAACPRRLPRRGGAAGWSSAPERQEDGSRHAAHCLSGALVAIEFRCAQRGSIPGLLL
jgi:hypothetical protein